jgi:hypothetical protein
MAMQSSLSPEIHRPFARYSEFALPHHKSLSFSSVSLIVELTGAPVTPRLKLHIRDGPTLHMSVNVKTLDISRHFERQRPALHPVPVFKCLADPVSICCPTTSSPTATWPRTDAPTPSVPPTETRRYTHIRSPKMRLEIYCVLIDRVGEGFLQRMNG